MNPASIGLIAGFALPKSGEGQTIRKDAGAKRQNPRACVSFYFLLFSVTDVCYNVLDPIPTMSMLSSKEKLAMPHRNIRAKSTLFGTTAIALLATATAHAQIRLTGSTLYNSASDGTATSGAWNTTPGDSAFNMYLFSGLPTAPVFFNSGDSTALVPNITLALGDNVIGFATATSPSQFFGMNLYFDGANTTNRITPVAQDSASGSGFSKVSAGISTYGLANAFGIPSANSLTYTSGALTATLTNFTITNTNTSGRDLVQPFNNVGDGQNDNVGSFTLRVTSAASAPEPGTAALLTAVGLPALGILRRRRNKL